MVSDLTCRLREKRQIAVIALTEPWRRMIRIWCGMINTPWLELWPSKFIPIDAAIDFFKTTRLVTLNRDVS